MDTAGYGLGTFEGSRGDSRIPRRLEELVRGFDQQRRPIGGSNYVRVHSATVSEWVDGVVMRVTIYPDIDEPRAAAERPAEERG
jgi:hypothetical protein